MSPAKTQAARRTTRDAVRQARNEVYRRHILEAAEQVFAENGFEAAKLQQISRLAGLSMGTIYGVFPGKTEILEALLEERGREILEQAGAVAENAKDPLAALNGLIETYVGYFVEHPHFLRMHLRQGTSWVISPASGANGRAVIWNEIHKLQAKIFQDGTAAGVFVDEDPGFLAKTFSAMDQVLLSDWEARGMKETPAKLVERLRAMASRSFKASSR
jgi:AcrR family transcriptional regulator